MSTKWIFSASEIDTFFTCRKKWALRYLDGIEIAPSKAMKLGSAIHEVLANLLSDQKSSNLDTNEGRIIRPGLIFLPKKISSSNIERHFAFTAGGHVFQGYIDFFEDLGSQKWVIGDHKTCSSLTYTLSPDQLKKDIQANVYSQWVFREKDAKEVNLKWIYYRTKSTPKAACVETTLTLDEAIKNFEPIVQAANEITEIIANQSKSSSLPRNRNACFKYGPCPFYAQCRPGAIRYQSRSKEDFKMIQPPPEAKNSAFHLYIDCMPTKREAAYERTIELSELLKPVLQKIQAEKELSHYRFASYGQYVALIANYLGQHLENSAYDSSTAILSSVKTPEGCDTLQTLSGAAGYVVRGF